MVILDRTGDMPVMTVQKATDETGAGVQLPTSVSSILVNGQADNAVYTLTGVRMDSPAQHGIYIQNGKKVVK